MLAAHLSQGKVPRVHLQTPRVADQTNLRTVFRKAAHDVDGPIAAHTVDHENLNIPVHALLREHVHQAAPDMRLFVVCRNGRSDRYAISAYNLVSLFAS